MVQPIENNESLSSVRTKINGLIGEVGALAAPPAVQTLITLQPNEDDPSQFREDDVNNALELATTVELDPGLYEINASIIVPEGRTLRGRASGRADFGGHVRIAATGLNWVGDAMIVAGTGAGDVERIGIRDLYLFSRTSGKAHGLKMTEVSGVHVDNVTARNCKAGFLFDGVRNSVMGSVWAKSNTDGGVVFKPLTRSSQNLCINWLEAQGNGLADFAVLDTGLGSLMHGQLVISGGIIEAFAASMPGSATPKAHVALIEVGNQIHMRSVNINGSAGIAPVGVGKASLDGDVNLRNHVSDLLLDSPRIYSVDQPGIRLLADTVREMRVRAPRWEPETAVSFIDSAAGVAGVTSIYLSERSDIPNADLPSDGVVIGDGALFPMTGAAIAALPLEVGDLVLWDGTGAAPDGASTGETVFVRKTAGFAPLG